MGLTANSTGLHAVDHGLRIHKHRDSDLVVALAGNPNVGKSTVFNELTGLKQHTGNWPGKTVTNAQGYYEHNGQGFVLVDLPGCYSLMAHSVEEEVARDFICFGGADAVIVVCDATCLERNLNLVLQAIEITPHVVVCVNLMDEAKRKKIKLDLSAASERLGVPVIGVCARDGKNLEHLIELVLKTQTNIFHPIQVSYGTEIEHAIQILQPVLEPYCTQNLRARWLALRLLDADPSLIKSLNAFLGYDILQKEDVAEAIRLANDSLTSANLPPEIRKDRIVARLIITAEDICNDVVQIENQKYNQRDRRLDRILTSKWTGFPIMFLLLAVILWITITGANYPSQWISNFLFWIEDHFFQFMVGIGAPLWLCEMLVHGVYRVLAWVVSVMLPPMAIFFPLFTLLEDLGYLPRVAFNLDKCFKKCHACGKQALTMCIDYIIL